MVVIFFWLIMAGVVALIAGAKGRNPVGWFLYGFLIWPIALVHILVTPGDEQARDERAIESGNRVRCPFCAELIRPEAKVCPHCQRDLARPKPKTSLAAPEPPRIETRWD